MTYIAGNNVPSVNSTDNNTTNDVIGNKADFVGVPYSFDDNSIMAHMNSFYYHFHGKPFCYPETASSITVTSGTGAWGTGGSITEVIPASTLTDSAFDLHWINMINADDDGEYYVEIYAGAAGSEELIGCTRYWQSSSFFAGVTGNTTKRIQIPQQSSGTRISCKLYSSDTGTSSMDISFEGHYYTL